MVHAGLAVSRSWPRVAKLLLDHGARVDITDAKGRTLRDAPEGKAKAPDRPQRSTRSAVTASSVPASSTCTPIWMGWQHTWQSST
jgi:hypothetical protein